MKKKNHVLCVKNYESCVKKKHIWKAGFHFFKISLKKNEKANVLIFHFIDSFIVHAARCC